MPNELGARGWIPLKTEPGVRQTKIAFAGGFPYTLSPAWPGDCAADTSKKCRSFSRARYPPHLLFFSRVYTASAPAAQKLVLIFSAAQLWRSVQKQRSSPASQKIATLNLRLNFSAGLGRITRERYDIRNKIR